MRAIITIEDHHEEGGLGEAVRSALAGLALPGVYPPPLIALLNATVARLL